MPMKYEEKRRGPKFTNFARNLEWARRFLNKEQIKTIAEDADLSAITVRQGIHRMLKYANEKLFTRCEAQRLEDRQEGYKFDLADYLHQPEVSKQFHFDLDKLQRDYDNGEIE